MTHTNLELIEKFFEAYARHDKAALQQVLAADVKWIFPGRNPASGTKAGIDEVITFFDNMGSIMGNSNVTVDKLISAANDDYVVECQRVRTDRPDGRNVDHQWCVLWKFKGGKIVEGRHLAADQYAMDAFFGSVMH